MENAKIIKTIEGGKNVTVNVESNKDSVINVDNSVVDNSVVDNSIVDNSTTVIHNHNNTVNLVGFGEEDLSFITPKFIASLLKIHEEDEDAVADFIKVVHFNPARPENMNICADQSTFNLFKDGRWNECRHEGDAAMHVAQKYADKILKHIELDDDTPDSAAEDRTDTFRDFHSHMHRSVDAERTFVDFIRQHSCMVTCKNEYGEFVLMVPKRHRIGATAGATADRG